MTGRVDIACRHETVRASARQYGRGGQTFTPAILKGPWPTQVYWQGSPPTGAVRDGSGRSGLGVLGTDLGLDSILTDERLIQPIADLRGGLALVWRLLLLIAPALLNCTPLRVLVLVVRIFLA